MKKAYRFSPSPTGKLHMGSARTALVSYIMAKKEMAEFHLRIEDTDKARSTLEFEHEVLESLDWLGVTSEHPIIRQSSNEQDGLYENMAALLIEEGLAYYCNCSTKDLKKMKGMQLAQKKPLGYEGTCRARDNKQGVLRLNINAVRMFLDPNEFGGVKDLRFTDSVYGPRHVDIRDLRDVVLLRSNGTATYLMANTVDDAVAEISHIVRGADLLPQTAIQILLRKVFKKVFGTSDDVIYSHVPLVLGENKEKLSKRNPDTKSILELRDEGILPEAIIQFILGVGNNSVPRDRAVSIDELTEIYDEKLNAKTNVAFSHHLLLHINKLHIRKLKATDISGGYPEDLIEVCKYRSNNLNDLRVDLKHSAMILNKYEKELKDLKAAEFCPQACHDFRAHKLLGSPSMGLDVLARLV